MRRRLRRVVLLMAAGLLAVSLLPGQRADAQFVIDDSQNAPARKPAPFYTPSRKMTAKEKAEAAKRERELKIAKNARMWINGREGGRPALLYTKPNGEDVGLSFSCDPAAGLVRVIAYGIPAKGLKAGDGGRVRLSNGPARLEVAATALANDKNPRDIDLGGTTKVSSRLFALFKGGDTMVLEVPGRTTGVSLKTLGQKGEVFERACLSGR